MARFFLLKKRWRTAMLQRLHEKVHGWLAGIVVGLIGITFVFFGASYYSNSRQSNQVKATVNGQEISIYQFDETYRRMKTMMPDVASISEARLKTKALEQLVYEDVLRQASAQDGFYISKAQAQKEILNTPDFQEDGKFSAGRFQQLLSSNMLTQSGYLNLLTDGMLNQQARFSFVGSSFVLPNEVDTYIKLANQKRSFQYLLLKPTNFNKDHQLKPQAIEAYYQAHQQQFSTEPKVAINYILLSMKQEVANAKVTAEEINTYYQENKDAFKTPARFKVKQLYISESNGSKHTLQDKVAKIEQGLKSKSFDAILAEHSDDLLADKDKKLPWLNLAAFPAETQKVISNLKLGQVSEPIYTSKGVEFVQLVEKQDAKQMPLEQVKASIEKNLKSDVAQRSFQQKADLLADLSYQNPESLESASSELNMPVKNSTLVTKQQGFEAPLNNAKVINAALSNEVLKEGNNSQLIQVSDDAVVVIRLKQYQPSKVKPLVDVKADIVAILEKQYGQQQAMKLAKQLTSVDLSTKDQQQLLASHQLNWQKASLVLRNSTDTSLSALTQFAFELPPVLSEKQQAQYKLLANNQIAIVKLLEVTDGKRADVSSDQLTLIESQLASNYGIKAYEFYIQAMRKRAEVKVF